MPLARPAVQALKDREDFLGIFLFEPDSIILDHHLAHLLSRSSAGDLRILQLQNLGRYAHHRLFAGTLELEGVADQILQKLPHLERIGLDDRQPPDLDFRAALIDAHFKI